jgi:hypothetical protein
MEYLIQLNQLHLQHTLPIPPPQANIPDVGPANPVLTPPQVASTALDVHYMSQGYSPATCGICFRSIADESTGESFKRHLAAFHADEVKSRIAGQCLWAGCTIHTKDLLKHTLTHSPGRFKCSVCQDQFKRRDALRRHKEGGTACYRCCSRSFESIQEKIRHKATCKRARR